MNIANLKISRERETIMSNRVFHINGACEECGFAYKGEVPNTDGTHPSIRCPNCGLQTKNLEDDYIVDAQEAEEGVRIEYADSKLEVVGG
jgi:hypothetical protein